MHVYVRIPDIYVLPVASPCVDVDGVHVLLIFWLGLRLWKLFVWVDVDVVY